MTHEEAVTFHVAQIVRSYRDLPLILYHFQVKERDEPRPRAGVLRTREFIMKDSYTFDRDQAGLERALRAARRRLRPHHGAHRPALVPRRGRRRHDGRARRARVHGAVRRRRGRGRARRPGYAANVEVARAQPGRGAGAASDYVNDGEPLTHRAGDRDRQHLQARHALLRAAGRHATSTSTAPSSRSGWAPTGSARRGSWRPRSSSSPTSTASPGRARSRRSPCTWSALGKPGTPERDAAERLTRRCCEGGIEVLYDDRDLGPGEKFADAELLGCPLRLTVGRRSLESGEIEVQLRRGRARRPGLPLDGEPGGARRGRWTSCGGASPRAIAAAEPAPRASAGACRPAPVRPGPLRARRRRRRWPGSRCARGRFPTRSASCGSR